MKLSGILKPLRDVKPVNDFLNILDLISSHHQNAEASIMPLDNKEEVINPDNDLISDLRLTNKLLYYQVNKFETVLDNLNYGIMLLDSSNRVFVINHIMEQLLNLKRGEIKGKHIKECQVNNEIFTFILDNAESADKLFEKTVEINTGTSSLLVSFKTLIKGDGNSCGSVLVAKDITTRKLADNERIGFLSYLSHELTIPVNMIKSYSEKLQESEKNSKEVAGEFLNIFSEEAERLSGLVNNILKLSKIEMGEMTFSKSLVRTREFVEGVFNRAVAGNKKNLKIGIDMPQDIAPLNIDKELIALAITNILNNAIYYTQEPGTVTLKVEEELENIMIHIIDTGVGVSEAEMPHIFDKFYRSSDEMVSMYRGHGLGLSIAKHMVALHEGEIRVSSRKGEGSQFTIVLPIGQGYFLE